MMNVGLAFRLGKADPEAERKSAIATAQNAKIARVEAKYASLQHRSDQKDIEIADLKERVSMLERLIQGSTKNKNTLR